MAIVADSFTLGSTYLADLNVGIGSDSGGLIKELFMPDIETSSESVTGKDGEYLYAQWLKPREFTIPCYFNYVDEAGRRNIQKVLSISGMQKLTLDKYPYKYIYVCRNSGFDFNHVWNADSYDNDVFASFFELPLRAPNPVWYSHFDNITVPGYIEDQSNYSTLYYDAGIPYAEDFVGGLIAMSSQPLSSTPYSFTLYNGGNYKAQTINIFTASTACSNIVVSNTTTGESFTISALTTGQSIIIDGVRGLITNIAGTIQYTQLFTGNFIHINPGDNNMTITGTGTLTNMQFNFRYTYL